MRQCWDLDAIGIKSIDDDVTVISEDFINAFNKNIHFNNDSGRYAVHLPWKSEEHPNYLLNNERGAVKRLEKLEYKLESNVKLRDEYMGVFSDLESKGIIEEVTALDSSNPVFYLPHRPVVREDSSSTKIRPVFDASAKGPNGVSLNDCMEVGPNLIPNLVSMLVRFRKWKFAITADIEKAFLQIEMNESDRDAHRFLLRDATGKYRHMRFTRITFGNAASPFILNAVVKFHISKYPETKAIQELKTNLYVDDLITGTDHETEVSEIMQDAKTVMSAGGFTLSKWNSNCSFVDLTEKEIIPDKEDTHKVLGMTWNSSNDCLKFVYKTKIKGEVRYTKRMVLSIIAKQFDPLGLLTPYTISLKILFQEVWQEGFDWDQPLPDFMQDAIEVWIKGLEIVSHWEIPRRVTQTDWTDDNTKKELIVFCDASEKAYGTCVYLKTKDSEECVHVSLLISKVRVAPLKKVTLPRLELLAALLGARLLRFVISSLHLPDNTSYLCFTDSSITIGWIKGEPHRWKQFIRNRVSEIQTLTDPARWKHVPGKENPADLLTRGVTASLLTKGSGSQFWLQGPEWLTTDDLPSPLTNSANKLDDNASVEHERVKQSPVCTISLQLSNVVEYDRFSCFVKLVSVISKVLKFKRMLMNKSDYANECTQTDNLSDAEKLIFKDLQLSAFAPELDDIKQKGVINKSSALFKLSPFLDSNGLLRVGGRLERAPSLSYDEIHPIILPRCHVTLLMVRSYHTKLNHAGVGTLVNVLRGKFWIVSVRPMAKRVVKFCVTCQRHNSRPLSQVTAPLPTDRLTQSPPFSVTGVDYAGPLYCSNTDGKKHYVLLFTCGVTRAIHLELVDSLNLDDFLLAFRRFVSRRALPNIIYSDNAKTFQAASALIHREVSGMTVKWKFICPLSPTWGGWWERLVRSVKLSLRKSIGKSTLSRSELETVLHESEACINSRPLTQLNDTGMILTPSHFLIGRGSPLASHEMEALAQVSSLNILKQNEDYAIKQFWNLWEKEYLRNLPSCKTKSINNKLKEGSIVIIRDENKKKMDWPLGIVTKLHRGLDGNTRAVEIKTEKTILVRSIQHLSMLEFDVDKTSPHEEMSQTSIENSVNDNENPNDTHVQSPDDLTEKNDQTVSNENERDHTRVTETQPRSRYGRKIKAKQMFDI